ncbi:MAG: hypothetical protein Q7S84_01595 [bacterium]|nr:hypothetical protein [bacterium]
MKRVLIPYLVAVFMVGALLGVAHLAFADTASTAVTVSNSAPSVSAVTTNAGSAITLTENTSTSVTLTGTITDANGCSDVITSGSVTIALYRSGVTSTSACTADSNVCYRTTTYSVQASDTCAGGTDTTANVSTTLSLWYYAEATDASSTYPTNTWITTITAADAAAASGNAAATGVELNSLYALNVTGSISYGSLTANTTTGASNQTATITNTGNYKTDTEFTGTDMTSGGNTIAATNEKYGLSDVTYASLSFSLSTSATNRDTNIIKTTTSTTPSTQATYWGISVPNGQVAAAYTGTNTFTSVYSAN